MPTMQAPSDTWLASLAAWPLPAPSKQQMLAAKVARMSRTGAMSFSVAPTIAVSEPAIAPDSPPVTGQSNAMRPETWAASAMSRASSGELVVRSIKTAPGLVHASRPSPAR